MSNPQNKKTTIRKAADDAIIYKALIDLGILLVAFYLLHYLNDFYPTVDGFFLLQPVFGWIAAVSAVAALVLFILRIVKKENACKCILPFGIGLGVIAVIALLLYAYWYHPLSMINIFIFGGCILYLIHLLYPADFTVIALLSFLSGLVCYLEKEYAGLNGIVLLFFVIAALGNIAAIVLALLAGKSGGILRVFGKSIRLFAPGRALPMIISAILLLLLTVACILLGAKNAVYCLYGAGIYAFLAACFYTVNLS